MAKPESLVSEMPNSDITRSLWRPLFDESKTFASEPEPISASMIIVFGCGNEEELIGRVNKCINFCRTECYTKFIMLTGTNKECMLMRKHILDSEICGSDKIFIENESKNTIDNVINTFSHMCSSSTRYGRRDVIHRQESDMGDPVIVKYSIDRYIILSSSYHIPRIKFIMRVCGVFDGSVQQLDCRNKTFQYVGNSVFDQSRIENEKRIERKVKEYEKYVRSEMVKKIYIPIFERNLREK
jgi:hypothetical protein